MQQGRPLSGVGRVDEATCKRLLSTYMKVGLALRALYPVLDSHELRAITEDAILEAFLSYREGRGATEATWVRKVIRWRLDGAARKSLQRVERDAEALEADPQVANGINPERMAWRARAVNAVALLEPRHQTIIIARMGGDTYAEVAESLGISTSRAQQEGARALELLREILETPARGRR